MCTMCATNLGTEAAGADAFAERMIGSLNHSALALMTSIGHRTGLFDAMRDGEPRTSKALARGAGLSERYVREWLGAMTSGQIVEYDPGSRQYRLPEPHARFLTRGAAANLAATMQWFALMGSVEGLIVDAFRHGKGVPYEAYERFHEVMAEESDQTCVAALEAHIIPLVDGLRQRLERGIDVIDVGCARGHAMLHLAKRFPASRFRGIDFAKAAIDSANAAARQAGLNNVSFQVSDAAAWCEPQCYDWITTFDAVHDQARPDRVLANIYKSLRSGGVYLMQEIAASSHVEKNVGQTMTPFIYTISTMHCMSVSLANGGMGLGAAWGRETVREMLGAAGFDTVEMRNLEHDLLNDYYVCRKR